MTVPAASPRSLSGRPPHAPEFSATEAKNSFGRVLDTAFSQGMVTITKRDRPTAVVLSMDAYQALLDAQRRPLESLSYEFDALLQGMQSPTSRAALMDAFEAPPELLGQAALHMATPNDAGQG